MTFDAADCLNHALSLIQAHALFADRINWNQAKAKISAVSDSQGIPSVHAVIRAILKELGDEHSFLLLPDAATSDTQAAPNSGPAIRLVAGGNVALIEMGSFGSNDPDRCAEYATDLQAAIADHDRDNLSAWVVDLRDNSGGNMWPMLTGLGPLLGEGEVGAFALPGRTLAWAYRQGATFVEDVVQLSVVGASHSLRARRPIAVLTGDSTMSSGEAVVVAFRGHPDARLFGGRTGGLSTCNTMFDLADGAKLLLTTGTFADRNGREYPAGIDPDEKCEPEQALPAAIRWISTGDRPLSDA